MIDFKPIFQGSPNPYLLLAPDEPAFTIIGVNDAYLHATKRTESELLGRPLFEAFPDNPGDAAADGVSKLDASLRRVLAERVADRMALQRYDIPRPQSEGGGFERRYWQPLNSPVFGADGQVAYIIHHVEDVTAAVDERREAAEALHIKDMNLKFAMDAGRMALWDVDIVNDTFGGSAELSRILGFDPDYRPTAAEIRARYAPGERARLQEIGKAALERGERTIETELRFVLPGGVIRWLMLRAEIVFGQDRRPLRALGVLIDIDDHKRAELAVRESEERFRLVADGAPVMLWMGDAQGKCVYLNKAQRAFWGVAEEDVATFDWNATVLPQDAETLAVPFQEGMRTQTGFSVEAHYRRADGAVRILSTDAQPRFGPDGAFLGMIGVNVDVTDMREAATALRRESRLLEIVNETGAAVAAERDIDRIVQKVTDAGVELTGAQFGAFFYNVPDESGGSYMLYTLSGVDREAFADFPMPRNTAVFGPTFRGEGVVRSDDILADPRYGQSAPYRGMPEGHLPVRSYLAIPVVSTTGEVLGGLFFGHGEPGRFRAGHEKLVAGIAGFAAIAVDNARLLQSVERELAERTRAEELLQALNATLEQRVAEEVSERIRAEEALRQAQKMEAIGQLTGGIAHDFNNMLAVVIGGLNLMQRRLAKGDTDVGRFIDGAMEGATRAATLTQRLLAFSRQQPLAPEPVSPNRLVSGMTEMLSRALGETVSVETVLSAGLWTTYADPAQLENTILNLAVNARDAMPEGGRLTIETANAHVDETYSREYDIELGQYVLICVTDTGAGMSGEVMAKAFDPFYTTKPVGKGTGLGLSQVFGFVRQSGGHVKIYSELGFGTTIKVYLPRYYGPEPADATTLSKQATLVHSGKPDEIILVVEDEERVRNYSVEALRELGYTVIPASSGAEAVRIIDAGQQVTLLFTDVVMPEMTGRQLADLAVQKIPGLKVIYTTGYTRNAVVHNGVLDPGTHFLPKPFGIDQLAAKVRTVLDS